MSTVLGVPRGWRGLRCFRVWGWGAEGVERPWGVRGIGGVLAAELGDGFGYARGFVTVVDASVLAKCLLREPGRGSVDRAVKEVASALWRRVFYGRIPFGGARELCRALTMPI